MIAWLKTNPDKASQGTGGLGTPSHVGGAFFQSITSTRFQFVHYRGGAGPAMQDLVGGHIDLMVDQALNSLPHLRDGRIKVYAVMDKARLASAPDIPTVDEAGLTGLYISSWYGLWAPKGAPQPSGGPQLTGLFQSSVIQSLFCLGGPDARVMSG